MFPTLRNAGLAKGLSTIAYIALAGILAVSFMAYFGAITIALFKTVAFALTVAYFILNGTATVIKFKNEASIRN